jgi:hypothetical protein
MSHPGGTRFKCTVCGSETILVKPQDPELTCCGQPLAVLFTPPAGANS